jgi:hypothetical protein
MQKHKPAGPQLTVTKLMDTATVYVVTLQCRWDIKQRAKWKIFSNERRWSIFRVLEENYTEMMKKSDETA